MRELDACGIGFVADTEGRPSRSIVLAALEGLANVKHRGAVAADARTSDGTGLLTTIPADILGADTGVAMLFVRGDDPAPAIAQLLTDEGLELVDWRTPPTDDDALGDLATRTRPSIVQAVFRPTAETSTALRGLDRRPTDDPLFDAAAEELERRAFRLRRRIDAVTEGTYVVSCSFRTIVHKGLVAADALGDFYLDLADPRFTAPLAIFHQRFSTNTLPTWERAQPFRMLCHNGEINTIDGNHNRMRSRSRLGTVAAGLGPEDLFRPVLDPSGSDSALLDEAAELLVRGGRSMSHALAMLIPEAWEETRDLDPEVRGFYEYHSALMEPWDGPAGVIFTDGKRVGAALDRNGLRPLRYVVCEDGLVVCASEMGAVPTSGHGSVDRGRLGPGHMLVVSPQFGIVRNHSVKEHLAAKQAPYATWAADGFYRLDPGEPVAEPPDDLVARQATHGYTREELAMVLKPMANDAYEPTFAMGDDSPLPPMADATPADRPLPQATLRPGHEPPDRSAAGAPRHEPAHPARPSLGAPRRTRRRLAPARPGLVLRLSLHGRQPPAARRQPLLHRPPRHDLRRHRWTPRTRSSDASTGRRRRPGSRRRRRHRRARRRSHRARAGADSLPPGPGSRPPTTRADEATIRRQPRGRGRRRPRHPFHRCARGLRRRPGVPAAGVADRRRGGRRRRTTANWSAPTPRSGSGPPSRPVCSRSSRRWGSRRSTPTGERRSSRCSASTRRSSTSASPEPPTRSAVSAGASSAKMPFGATSTPTASRNPRSGRRATTASARAASTTPTPRRSPRRSTCSPSRTTRHRSPSATPRPSTRRRRTSSNGPSPETATTSTPTSWTWSRNDRRPSSTTC